MNDSEMEKFEADLRRTRPARVPEQFMNRLTGAKPVPELKQKNRRPVDAPSDWWRTWLWLAPALGVAMAGLFVVRANIKANSVVKKAPLAATLQPQADDVQVDQQLVSSFDVVAKLPGGEPVRFHCRKWNDQVVVTDTNGGVEIEKNSPRVEVVPVRFETY